MNFQKSLILDFFYKKNNIKDDYWIYRIVKNEPCDSVFLKNNFIPKKSDKSDNFFKKSNIKFNSIYILKADELSNFKNIKKRNEKISLKLKPIKIKDVFTAAVKKARKGNFDENYYKNLENSTVFGFKSPNRSSNFSENFFTLFNINFLKKERAYAKLKYSRTPKFDIVSGGLAAFLTAFLGFLTSEKFGMELADSGDFFYLFLYILIFCYSLRNFFKYIAIESSDWGFFFSLKFIFSFYKNLFALFFKFLNKIKNKINLFL